MQAESCRWLQAIENNRALGTALLLPQLLFSCPPARLPARLPAAGVRSPAAPASLQGCAAPDWQRDEGWGRRVGSQAGRGGGGKGREREPSPWIHGNNTPFRERGRGAERTGRFLGGSEREPSTPRIWIKRQHWKRQGSCCISRIIYRKGGKPAHPNPPLSLTVEIDSYTQSPDRPPPAPAAPPLRRRTAPATEMHTETRNKKVSTRYWLFPGQWKINICLCGWCACTQAELTLSGATAECHWVYKSHLEVYQCRQQFILQLVKEFCNHDLAALKDQHDGSAVISHLSDVLPLLCLRLV